MDVPKKSSFVLHNSFFEPIKHLSNEDLGKLFRTIYEYHSSEDGVVEEPEPSIKMAFEFFKNQFRHDRKQWENRVKANRINAVKGGRPKGSSKPKVSHDIPTNPNGIIENPTKPKKPDYDYDYDDGDDYDDGNKVQVNDQKNLKEIKSKQVAEFVLKDLNERLQLKKGFSCFAKITKRLIGSRLADGFTCQDFIDVNEKKCSQWRNDPDMAKFLRPETLYGNKFEGYFNEREVNALKVINKPKYQTADERRQENNKKVFTDTLKEIEDVHRTGSKPRHEEAESDNGFFSQLRRELP